MSFKRRLERPFIEALTTLYDDQKFLVARTSERRARVHRNQKQRKSTRMLEEQRSRESNGPTEDNLTAIREAARRLTGAERAGASLLAHGPVAAERIRLQGRKELKSTCEVATTL